jgi:hypothetical protein
MTQLNVEFGMGGCVLAVGGSQELGVFETPTAARGTKDLKAPLQRAVALSNVQEDVRRRYSCDGGRFARAVEGPLVGDCRCRKELTRRKQTVRMKIRRLWT